MRYEQETWLKALLRIEDMCSMKFGVEVREPLLDYRIVELARSADIQSFAHKGLGKRPLVSLLEKRSGRRYTRRDKKGFAFDVRNFLPTDDTIRNYCEKLNLSYSSRLSIKQKWMITNAARLLH